MLKGDIVGIVEGCKKIAQVGLSPSKANVWYSCNIMFCAKTDKTKKTIPERQAKIFLWTENVWFAQMILKSENRESGQIKSRDKSSPSFGPTSSGAMSTISETFENDNGWLWSYKL